MRGLAVKFRNPGIHSLWPPAVAGAEQARPFAIPPDRRALDFLVEPIAEAFRPLYWLAWQYDSSPFVEVLYLDHGEERLENAIIELFPHADFSPCLLFRAGWLPDHLGYLYDDWQDLIGFSASSDEEAAEIARAVHNLHGGTVGAHDPRLESSSEFRFFCIDGREWRLFARDESLIDLIEARIKDIPGLELRRTTLGEGYS